MKDNKIYKFATNKGEIYTTGKDCREASKKLTDRGYICGGYTVVPQVLQQETYETKRLKAGLRNALTMLDHPNNGQNSIDVVYWLGILNDLNDSLTTAIENKRIIDTDLLTNNLPQC